jgi:hypothetical protein
MDTEPAKPTRAKKGGTGGKTTAGRAAAKNGANPQEPGDLGYEDWSRPDYADDPGDVEFDTLDGDEDEFYRVLEYGPEGTGKTTDLCTMLNLSPKGKLLIINAEGGVKRRPLQFHGIDTSRIATYPPKGQELTFEGLERLFYRLQYDLEKDPTSWLGVGWDSATAIHQTLIDNVIDAEIRSQAEILQRAGKGRGGRSGNITLRDRFENDRDDYRKMSNQFRLLLRKYRTLPCHLVITALERRDEDKGKDDKVKRVIYGPAVTPALQTDLLGYVDVVVRTLTMDTKGGQPIYYGRTAKTEDARGKDRIGGLPIELVDPTFERIAQYFSGELDEATDPVQKLLPGGADGAPKRRSLARSGIDTAPAADEPAETVQVEEDKPEPPKRAPRKTAAQRRAEAEAAKPEMAIDTEPPQTTEERDAEVKAARGQAVEEGIAAPPAGRAKKGGSRAATKRTPVESPPAGFSDEPPF